MIERRSLTTDYFHLMTRSALSTLGGIVTPSREVPRVNRRLRADLSDSVVTEGGKEVLCHRTIVAKLSRIVPNAVPAC